MADERLTERVRQLWREEDVPGAVVGVSYGGARVVATCGVTSMEHPLPVTGQTYFQVGSISKTFTALTLLKLMARGVASLDASLQTILPELQLADASAAQQVTARHLLTHRAGWQGDFFINTGKGSDALASFVARMSELKQHAPPGVLFAYNNAAFSLAGYLIERLSQMPYEAAVEANVLAPLGLRHTSFEPAEVMTHRFAVGHVVAEDRREVARPWPLPRCSYPSGGVVTTIDDLLTYAECHLGRSAGGEAAIDPATLDALWQPQHWIVPGRKALGLSWFLDDWGATRLVSHQGATNGQVASLFLVPEQRFAVAALTNSSRGSSFTLPVTRWALQHYLAIEPPIPPPLQLSRDALQEYAGLYRRPFADVRISVAGRNLSAEVQFKQGFPAFEDTPPPDPPPLDYAPYAEDSFFAEDALGLSRELKFLRGPDGHITLLRALNRIHTWVA